MKINKNIIALTMTLSIISPIKSNDSFDEETSHKAIAFIEETEQATEARCFTTIENTKITESISEEFDSATKTESDCNDTCNELTQPEIALATAITMDLNQIIDETTTQEEAIIVTPEQNLDENKANKTTLEENITNNPIVNLYIEYSDRHSSISISDEFMTTEKKDITLEQARILFQDAITDISLIIPASQENGAQKLFTPAQKEALSTIVSNIMNAVATQLDIHQHQALLEKNGIAILQACANNLTIGSQFTLNGVTYRIVAQSEDTNN